VKTDPVWLTVCDGDRLQDGGLGVRFDLPQSAAALARGAAPIAGFVVRVRGRAHAYLNRCAHLPIELDWQPGHFFDETGLRLICATHGAVYEADTGLCVAGPCRGASLQAWRVKEEHNIVYVADSRV
jgi:nitrite reductase/ring-hydroxylating ferredoxin subunit